MAITSAEIANVSFSIDRKGYDVDEVDVFLEHVADEIDALNDEVALLQTRAAQAEQAAQDALAAQAVQVKEPEPVVAAPDETQAFTPVPVNLEADGGKDAEIADLRQRLAANDVRIAELQVALENAKADGSAISQALIVAQRSAAEVVANAKAQAEQIILDARVEADNIIIRANEDKAAVEDEIDYLEISREESRQKYQDLLQDFITDAAQKLNEIAEKKATHAAVATASAAPSFSYAESYNSQSSNQFFNTADAFAAAPQAEEVTYVPATPTPSAVEKDLSGFGDADDDFDVDDLD